MDTWYYCEAIDPLSYHVETENGIEIRRHADLLQPSSLETPKQPTPISEKEKNIPDDDFDISI